MMLILVASLAPGRRARVALPLATCFVQPDRLELELSEFHLPTALDNALTLVRERATRHGIRLTQTVDERGRRHRRR